MKIVMTLLVRNEEDILRENLEHHFAKGVDFVIAMDHLSQDGTREILEEFEREGILEVHPQMTEGYYQSEWVTWMARRAASVWQADWVINADADEFWWPGDGDLKTALGRVSDDVDVLSVRRCNFPPVASPGAWWENMLWRDTQSVNALGRSLPNKVCHRGDAEVTVTQGNHAAKGPRLRSSAVAERIEILHFPVRSLEQFEQKIRDGGRAYGLAGDLPPNRGRTWRELYQRLQDEGLRRTFDAECLPHDQDQWQRGGRFVLDPRLRDFLRAAAAAQNPGERTDVERDSR